MKPMTGSPPREMTDAEYADWQRSVVGLSPTATDAELAAAQVAQATAAAHMQAIASIYAPVEYQGKMYPADKDSIAKYELGKASRTRGTLRRGIAIATDGTILKLSTPQAIDEFHAAIDAAVAARVEAVHDLV